MNEKPNDLPSNNDTSTDAEWADPVFDSFLEEAVTGRHPTDLRARILNAWQQEQAGRIPLPNSQTNSQTAAGNLIAPPVVEQQTRTASPSKASVGENGPNATNYVARVSGVATSNLNMGDVNTGNRASQSQRRSYAWQVLLVVAASGAMIACALQWRSSFMPSDNSLVSATENDKAKNRNANDLASGNSRTTQTPRSDLLPSESKSNDSKAGEIASTNSPTPANDGSGVDGFAKDTRAVGENQKLALENVPFAKGNSNPTYADRSNVAKPSSPRLSDQQIVELIDTQLATLWQRLKVVPASRMDDLQLAQALSKTLAGQQLPNAALAELAELKPAERLDRVISQAVDSQAFARRWAGELTSQWTRGGSLARDSAAVKRLEEFLASGIAGAKSWNEVVTQVLSGESAAGDVLVSSMAGGGNHRLASRLSSSFMDSSLACVRCHESKNPTDDVKSQEQYWSLVALLMGLDVRTSEPTAERSSIDKQAELFAATKQPSLFFERPDGTLEAAKFVLPDGQPWQSVAGAHSPRAALAMWIGNSVQADEAIVNQIWQVALGRPLVAANAVLDDAGIAERTELQQLLAQQFRAHGRRLPQLIGWIVRSDAFARDALKIDQNRWLQAPESDIENWHLAEMTFAARSSLGQQAVKGGLENALAAATKWNQSITASSNSVQANGPSVLAQPNVDPKLKSKTPVKIESMMPAVGYAIHRGRLSGGQKTFISRLAASEKLTWEQKVEHIVSLSPNQSTSNNVKRLSEELLKSLNDPGAALTELLWAVQNVDAG